MEEEEEQEENKSELLNNTFLEEELSYNEETGDWEIRFVDTRTLKEFKEQQNEINLNLAKNNIFVYKDEIESQRILKDVIYTELDETPIGLENLAPEDKKLYESFIEKKKSVADWNKIKKTNRGRAPVVISEKQIRYSMENSISIKEAANFLKVGRISWTKYAKMYIDPIENKSLYEIFMFKNWGVTDGKNLVYTKEYRKVIKSKQEHGILNKMIDPETNKYVSKYESDNVIKKRKIRMHDVLQGLHPDYDPVKLKRELFKIGWLEQICECCSFSESRKDNGRSPFILNFKDGNKKNHKRDNLQILCFNCFFIKSELYDNRYYYRF